ncbi:MAG: methylmalonyl-CoA mutase subunit beta [Deltaproteobacteria bacterium]|nr:methylmalonyl-CoA mutase subunit beta [Deltaproteobacteria bacterium]MBT8481344.1 methylmalonyl-CoA mutase subunit beta [Deltaproteobacteria bacterium]NND28618.1 methylmalonyl-CoA mutase small subunit [Myxococcales bacterium]NNK06962.1 methylmalonyl-CoA mutase small subunit [Myxococcales bacterium]NNL24207.1 methylmalonyl-CoA mutase small subunit [Myxococcales bacterium]
MSNFDERMNVFPPVSKSEWIAKVEADLKGASFDRLRSAAPGGPALEPLYAAQDVEGLHDPGLPGVVPYLRGASPLGTWSIRQEYDEPRPVICKEMIRQDVERGVEALWLRLGPRRGCRVITVNELDELLAAVDLRTTSVCLDGGSDALAVASGFLAVAKRRGLGCDELSGGLGFDPIGLLAAEGCIQGGLRARSAELRDLAIWCSKNAPDLRAVNVSGEPYDGGGASIVQELAYTIATGIHYLRELTDAGMSVDAAARQIGFSYAVAGDFFTQVAKLRAARWLWAKVVLSAGGEPSSAAMHMHCRTSRFTKARIDPWVNMLRATAECTAAVLGGAHSIATLPFDCVIGSPDELARRVARNTQVVLREESHLGEVADPAGGSWFIERLTNDLARAAWTELRSIEAEGGVVHALGSGKLVDAIRDVADEREKAFCKRTAALVGVSEFPNLREGLIERPSASDQDLQALLKASLESLDLGANRDLLLALARSVKDEARTPGTLTAACVDATSHGADMYSVATVLQHGQPDFHVEPILQWRASEIWERQRERSDSQATRPAAFLANLGSIASHTARATWAQNLLAAVGVDAITNDGFDGMDALAAAWKSSAAGLAVICGSDADYDTMLEPAVAALKKAGCDLVIVAGRPGERESEVRALGAHEFIYAGADVLSAMTRVLDAMGVQG